MFGCDEGLLEASEGDVGEEVASVSFLGVVFEAVVGEEGVGGEGYEVDGDARHEEDEPLGESEYIFLYLRGGGFPFFVVDLFEGEYFFDWGDDVAEDVIFADDVGVGSVGVDDDELILVFVVPDDLVKSIGDHFEGEVCFGGGVEEVDFPVLVLQDQFGAVFVGEEPEDGVVWFVLHDY